METDRIQWKDGWLFALTEEETAVCADYDDHAWRRVSLPHDWQLENGRGKDAPGAGAQGFFPREQRGVYRLHFTAEESWRGKCVHVLFDGIQRFSSVWLNGEQVGGRPYGYLPVLCDLTRALRFDGENVLAVSVDNRLPEGRQWYAAGGDRWYSGAGIYRKVWLLVDEPVHLVHDGVRVIAEPLLKGPGGDIPDVAGIQCAEARVAVRAELEGEESESRAKSVRAEIFSADGRLLCHKAQPAGPECSFDFLLEKPKLWTPETPYLYTLRVTLSDCAAPEEAPDGAGRSARPDGACPAEDTDSAGLTEDTGSAVLDVQEVRFGVRSAVFDTEDGFVLNGVKRKLWGVNLHHDGGMFGAAVPEKFWRRRLESLKKMGVNTIRASHNPMAEEMYDLCDELGFLVIDELYDKWDRSGMYFDAFFADWHERDVRDWVRRDANHPSVILWSVGNEVAGQYSEHYYACLSELCKKVRSLDPTRPLTTALIGFCFPEYNDRTPLGKKLQAVKRYADTVDVFMGNYMEPYYERMRDYGIRNPIIGSEVHAYYRPDERTTNTAQVARKCFSAAVRRHDWVCGAILWAGIDYLGESTGWPFRGWTGNPLDSTGEWKLRAWHAAAQFKDEPVMKLAVFDESEPWDGARGMWGFPQMRAHWKYSEFEKVMHVGVMTNCDIVKLYQNSQTERVGYLSDSEDGMIHFWLPYIPGVLRAEGYKGGMKVCEDVLYSDHDAANLRIRADGSDLLFDENEEAEVEAKDSPLLLDLYLEDAHGQRFCLEDLTVTISEQGEEADITADSGNPAKTSPFTERTVKTFNGHLLLAVMPRQNRGETQLLLRVEKFEEKRIRICWMAEGNASGYGDSAPYQR